LVIVLLLLSLKALFMCLAIYQSITSCLSNVNW